MEDMIPTEHWVETFPGGEAVSEDLAGKLLQHFRGYIVLAGIGVAFAVFLLLAGCCSCCCCCCCCCCRRTKKISRGGARRKACAGCFATFVALLLLGVTFAIVAAGFVGAQFAARGGLVEQVAHSVGGLDSFLNGTAHSLRDVKHTVGGSLMNIAGQVGKLPEMAQCREEHQ